MLQIDDPRKIPTSEGPWIVFYNNLFSEISWAIDWKTNIKGIPSASHAMISRKQGFFVAQEMKIFNAYQEVPMEQYMIDGGQLAFVRMVNTNPAFMQAFNMSIDARLHASWWETQYDFLGVFVGQAFKNPWFDTTWIHTPGLRFCSVDVIRHLTNSSPQLPKADQIVINKISPEDNPEELRQTTIINPLTFILDYVWDSKKGVVLG